MLHKDISMSKINEMCHELEWGFLQALLLI